jgi:hypothetical protein
MGGYRQAVRKARSDKARTTYVLIVRGPDGRARFEHFNDAASYRARLLSLETSENGSISIEEIAGLLDA